MKRPSNLIRLSIALAIVVATVTATSPTRHHPRHVGAVRPLFADVLGGQALASLPTPSQCLASFGIRCYGPAQIQAAYDVGPLHAQGIDGRGRTIVIVDPFGSPTIRADLQAFDQKFGLADPPSLRIIQPVGAVPHFDPTDPDMATWAGEATLDVEWAHVMAPGANILLVETPVTESEGVAGFPEIVKAENYVIDHDLGDVISQSFGATEATFPSKDALLDLRSAFVNAKKHEVTVLAGSGDQGATSLQINLTDLYATPVVVWPSSDPLVTSVGGTQLSLDDAGHRVAPDVVWNDGAGASGGGVSSVFGRPGFQNHVKTAAAGGRATPDLSMSAAQNGAVFTYSTFDPANAGFHLASGTSEAVPLFAGIVAMADQLAGRRLGLLNPSLYRLESGAFVDVTKGNNTFGPFTNSDGRTYTVSGYTAGPGYDLASGLGTVDAARFVPALARQIHDANDDNGVGGDVAVGGRSGGPLTAGS